MPVWQIVVLTVVGTLFLLLSGIGMLAGLAASQTNETTEIPFEVEFEGEFEYSEEAR